MTEREVMQALDGISLRPELKDRVRKRVVTAQRRPRKVTQESKRFTRQSMAIVASLVVVLSVGGIWGVRQLSPLLRGGQAQTTAGVPEMALQEEPLEGGAMPKDVVDAKEPEGVAADEIEEHDTVEKPAAGLVGSATVYGAVHELSVDKLTLTLHDGQTLTLILSEEWKETLSREELVSGVLAEVWYNPETMELLDLIRQ